MRGGTDGRSALFSQAGGLCSARRCADAQFEGGVSRAARERSVSPSTRFQRVTIALALLAACSAPPAPAPVPSAGLPLVAPESLGFDSLRLDSVVVYLQTQVDSAFPGAVVAVGRHGRLALLAAVGHYAANDPRPVEPGTVYDLASLTKVIALTTECILLVDQGKLDLDAPVQRYVPEFRGPMKDSVTIRHLLTHSASRGDRSIRFWPTMYSGRSA